MYHDQMKGMRKVEPTEHGGSKGHNNIRRRIIISMIKICSVERTIHLLGSTYFQRKGLDDWFRFKEVKEAFFRGCFLCIVSFF